MRTLKLAALAVAATLTIGAPRAFAATDEQNLVDKARITVDDMKRDKEFGNAQALLHRARGIMIVPALVKGGFFFGGEGGEGVLLARGQGGWSQPAFYTMASASFGLQIGLEQSELVLIILSDRALNAFMNDQFKIGAQAGLAIVTLGSEAEAATTANLNADIVVWSSATGAYAGLTLNGSVIVPKPSYNEGFYGRPENPHNIIMDRSVPAESGANMLRTDLASIAP